MMLEMVRDINAKFGDGKTHVTCWTFLESRFAALQMFIDPGAMREIVRDTAVNLQQDSDKVVTAGLPFDKFLSHCLD